MKTFDLVVIGSGTAAQVASARVRKAGRTVAVVDHRPFGGTCALRGCDPKKMLIGGADAVDAGRRMQGHGVAGELRINWPKLIAFKRTFTDPVPQKQEAYYAAQGIDAFHGLARFTEPDAVPSQDRSSRRVTSLLLLARVRCRSGSMARNTLSPVTAFLSWRACRRESC